MARRSISRIVSGLAEADPGRVVAVAVTPAGEQQLTAAALKSASNRYARLLLERGVRRDDLVILALPNRLEMLVACVAVWKAGATPQPVSRGLTPHERAEVVATARPALVVGFEADGVASLPGTGPHGPEATDDGPLPDAWARSWKAPTSSGSTGRPKVVLSTAPALLDPSRPVADFVPLRATQLVSGPLTHSATFTYAFRGLFTGHTLVILPRFEERAVLTAIERHGVTWALLVPTMLHRLLRLPAAERDPGRLRTLETVLHLGSPCAPALKRAVLDWLGPGRVIEVYAGSESNGLTMIRGDEWLARPGSVGRPIGGTQVRVLREDGTDAAPGETGQVWMRRGADPAYTYLGAVSRRRPDGWDTLGDLGHLDADGWLWLTDRSDDVIVRGGEKVYPVDVERVLEEHPAVRSALAFGVPDDEFGQHVEAVADVAGARIDGEELRSWAAARLDAARRPMRVRVTHQPLRDDAGKARRGAVAT
ncbi:AMP-binding protein [Myceligenerans pegani]|uniref:AMP-binding protein n=1 Tax=Myceligenerans pegani TaxID=2776917 RepID=A0ABR9MWI6_9MICO|nr:AMP-binding protein [Myceligenerans sp. TRM 65318]MBE1875411.1 AMP-binding protein [Myceligenerans sp. TRM 65318]MBE3017682.1 AMP-binding protein [Myceligenerans sp. TRM 65318]